MQHWPEIGLCELMFMHNKTMNMLNSKVIDEV